LASSLIRTHAVSISKATPTVSTGEATVEAARTRRPAVTKYVYHLIGDDDGEHFDCLLSFLAPTDQEALEKIRRHRPELADLLAGGTVKLVRVVAP